MGELDCLQRRALHVRARAKVASTPAPTSPATSSEQSIPQASVSPNANTATSNQVPGGAIANPQGERITLTTDLLKVEISTAGGELMRVELLKHKDAANPEKMSY